MQRNVKCMGARFTYIHTYISSLTVSSHFSISVKSILNFSEYFIEISRVELEKARLPILASKVSRQDSFVDSIEQYVLVKVKRNKLLAVAILNRVERMNRNITRDTLPIREVISLDFQIQLQSLLLQINQL
jgi:hypothetical protein